MAFLTQAQDLRQSLKAIFLQKGQLIIISICSSLPLSIGQLPPSCLDARCFWEPAFRLEGAPRSLNRDTDASDYNKGLATGAALHQYHICQAE